MGSTQSPLSLGNNEKGPAQVHMPICIVGDPLKGRLGPQPPGHTRAYKPSWGGQEGPVLLPGLSIHLKHGRHCSIHTWLSRDGLQARWPRTPPR